MEALPVMLKYVFSPELFSYQYIFDGLFQQIVPTGIGSILLCYETFQKLIPMNATLL